MIYASVLEKKKIFFRRDLRYSVYFLYLCERDTRIERYAYIFSRNNMLEIVKIWLTDTAVCIRTKDGREASEPFARYPRLANASPDDRADFILSPFGIHWQKIDEDLCFDGFFA